MQATVSSSGEIVVPSEVREQMGLRPGDELEISVQPGKIVMTTPVPVYGPAHIEISPITGLPVLVVDGNPPALTSEHVAELLKDFP